MPGERSYSTAAVQALCDAYYGDGSRHKLEHVLDAARRRRLHVWLKDLDPTIEAEIAQISRARAYELLREDPRYNDQDRTQAALNAVRDRIDHFTSQGIEGWGKARELDKLLELLDNAKARATQLAPWTPPDPPASPTSALLAKLTRAQRACDPNQPCDYTGSQPQRCAVHASPTDPSS